MPPSLPPRAGRPAHRARPDLTLIRGLGGAPDASARPDGNHGRVTTAAAPPRRLYRRPDRGIAGGRGGRDRRPRRRLGPYSGSVRRPRGGRRPRGRAVRRVPDRRAAAPDAGPGRLPAWLEYVGAAHRRGRRSRRSRLVAARGRAVPPDPARLPRWRADLATGVRARTRPVALAVADVAVRRRTRRLGRIRLRPGAALVVAGAVRSLAKADFTALRDGAGRGGGHRGRAGADHRPVVDADGDPARRRARASASARRSARTSPRTCTTRCCRPSRSSSATPARRARSPGWPAARSGSCAPCSTGRGTRPGSSAERAAHRGRRGRGRLRDHGRRGRGRRRARWTTTSPRSPPRAARRWSTRPSTPGSTPCRCTPRSSRTR